MSLQTWKEEFYPKPVEETTEQEAAQHSLTKWQGLTSENLAKHGVRIDFLGCVVDQDNEEGLVMNGSTCALCYHHLDKPDRDEDQDKPCETCPLYLARDKVPCTDERDDEDVSPWYEFRDETPNPQPMIYWLQEAVEYQAESNAK